MCSNCGKTVTSQVARHYGCGAWTFCVLMIVVFPLNYLPFCVECFKDIRHICPECNAVMGMKNCC